MVPFVGPSYTLANRKADVQRTVNMYPKRVESGTGRAQYFLKSIPGLVERFDIAGDPEIRGFASIAGGRAFVVAGDTIYEIEPDFSQLTSLAGLTTSTGPVSMAVGREHLVVADGTDSPVYYEFAAAAGFYVNDADFYPSSAVTYLGGRFVFMRDGTDQFFWSAQDDPSSYDALDFATAESLPDGLVWMTNYHEELWLFGTGTVETWRVSTSADSAFERNAGVSINIGCSSGQTVQKLDNSLFWIGEDDNGGPVGYRVQGYNPTRFTNYAIEEKLQDSSDISEASAYCLQRDGMAFYCINAPGVDTTLCFEVQGDWHERAELVDGEYTQHRARHHVYVNGLNLIGTEDGFIFSFSDDVYTNAGDTLCRERISPHAAAPNGNLLFFPRFRLICTTGSVTDASTPVVELSYSNDGGVTFHDSMPRSLGTVGQTALPPPQWNRLGSARDRVWKIRCTDDVLFDIIAADAPAMEGSS